MTSKNSKLSINLEHLNFYLLGISVFIGYYSIISSLDFFSTQYNEPNLAFYFNIPSNLGIILTTLLIGYTKKFFSTKRMIIFSLLLICIITIFFPLLACLFPNKFWFWLFLILNFIFSIITTILQCHSFALVSVFPDKCMAFLNAGQTSAGLLVTIIRIIILSIYDTNDQNYNFSMFFFYGVSFLIVVLTLLIYLKFEKETKLNFDPKIIYFTSENLIETEKNMAENTHSSYERKQNILDFWYAAKAMFPYSLLLFLVLVQTTFCFPGMLLGYNKLNTNIAWNDILLILIMNFFDVFGNYSSTLGYFSQKTICTILVFSRFILCFFLYLLFLDVISSGINNNYFCVVNLILFAFSDGYLFSIILIKGPSIYTDQVEKETAEYSMVFLMNLGIIIGSTLSLVMLYI